MPGKKLESASDSLIAEFAAFATCEAIVALGGRADLGDLRAIHDQRCVLDHASVAHNQLRAFERRNGAL